MGFFKNINVNIDIEAFENYIKNKEWKIGDSLQDLRDSWDFFNAMTWYWGTSFNNAFDITWSFKLVNGTYMIDSSILYEGGTYREVHALKDAEVLFQAMINKIPIRIGAGVKYVDNRHIVIRLIFDINNGGRVITIYEVRRKIKAGNFEASYNPNYNFEQNYVKQQQKFAKHHSYNSQYRFKK